MASSDPAGQARLDLGLEAVTLEQLALERREEALAKGGGVRVEGLEHELGAEVRPHRPADDTAS